MIESIYKGRRVLVTGHTGFKGSWLTRWLLLMDATVSGYALSPEPHETLYDSLDISQHLVNDYRKDVRDLTALSAAIKESKPEFVFHLAAQPLVRKSYEFPADTFATNVMGTVNVLEAVRQLDSTCVVIVVTTDKCYENREWEHSYREEDPLGGHDPYSASKGCAELVASAYRRSFFDSKDSKISIASARAGNVIGGGDWAHDRIVPDIFRAVFNNQVVGVRNRHATRPWQHVLEPLSAYLWLAACLQRPQLVDNTRHKLSTAFNFGPSLESNRSVADIVTSILQHTGGQWADNSPPNSCHEASKLNLAIDKAFHLLSWHSTWDFNQTIKETCKWYLDVQMGKSPKETTIMQIRNYHNLARERKIRWAI